MAPPWPMEPRMPRRNDIPAPEPASVEDRHELWKRISKMRAAMLATHDRDSLAGRPLAPLRIDPDGTLFFFTSKSGGIAEDLHRSANVYLCFIDVGDDIYVWL